MATMIDPDAQETADLKDEAWRGVEYPVQLAHTPEPVLRLVGTVRVIRPGRRDLALSEQEWRDLGLEKNCRNCSAFNRRYATRQTSATPHRRP